MELSIILPRIVLALSALAVVLNIVARYSAGKYLDWKVFNVVSIVVLVMLSGGVIGSIAVSRLKPDTLFLFTDSKGWNFFLGIITMMFITFVEFRLFQNIISWIDRRSSVRCDLRLTLFAVLIPMIIGLLKTFFTSGYNAFPKDFWQSLTFGAGFWEFLSALSMVLAGFLIIFQLVQFVVALRNHLPYLFLLLGVYAIVFVSLVFLAVYAAMGLVLLLIVCLICGVISALTSRERVVVEIRDKRNS